MCMRKIDEARKLEQRVAISGMSKIKDTKENLAFEAFMKNQDKFKGSYIVVNGRR